MKIRINGYDVEGSLEDIRRLIDAPPTLYIQTKPKEEPVIVPWQPYGDNTGTT